MSLRPSRGGGRSSSSDEESGRRRSEFRPARMNASVVPARVLGVDTIQGGHLVRTELTTNEVLGDSEGEDVVVVQYGSGQQVGFSSGGGVNENESGVQGDEVGASLEEQEEGDPNENLSQQGNEDDVMVIEDSDPEIDYPTSDSGDSQMTELVGSDHDWYSTDDEGNEGTGDESKASESESSYGTVEDVEMSETAFSESGDETVQAMESDWSEDEVQTSQSKKSSDCAEEALGAAKSQGDATDVVEESSVSKDLAEADEKSEGSVTNARGGGGSDNDDDATGIEGTEGSEGTGENGDSAKSEGTDGSEGAGPGDSEDSEGGSGTDGSDGEGPVDDEDSEGGSGANGSGGQGPGNDEDSEGESGTDGSDGRGPGDDKDNSSASSNASMASEYDKGSEEENKNQSSGSESDLVQDENAKSEFIDDEAEEIDAEEEVEEEEMEIEEELEEEEVKVEEPVAGTSSGKSCPFGRGSKRPRSPSSSSEGSGYEDPTDFDYRPGMRDFAAMRGLHSLDNQVNIRAPRQPLDPYLAWRHDFVMGLGRETPDLLAELSEYALLRLWRNEAEGVRRRYEQLNRRGRIQYDKKLKLMEKEAYRK